MTAVLGAGALMAIDQRDRKVGAMLPPPARRGTCANECRSLGAGLAQWAPAGELGETPSWPGRCCAR